MKKFTFLFAVLASVLLSISAYSQTSITICGVVTGTNGVSVPVTISDANGGILSTVLTDSSGLFCDTILASNTQGSIVVGLTDCNGVVQQQTFSYSPFLNQFTVTFNFCNTVPPNSFVLCVTVDNLPGTTVPVIITSAGSGTGDTLFFTGTGTQTICDTVQATGGALGAQISMVDCNGNTVTATATYNPMLPTSNVTINYCQPVMPVTVCGMVNGNNGMSVPIVVTDPATGNTFTLFTDSSGYVCDSLALASAPGQVLTAYIIDCNGVMQTQTAVASGGNPVFNFTFNYCNTVPSSMVLCVTMDNLPGGGAGVPVMVYGANGMVYDTLFFTGTGTQTICDTIPVNSATGVLLVDFADCSGVQISGTVQYNPQMPVANITFDYCSTVPPCYAFWTSTYDTTTNTFYITVDSITLAQAWVYLWDFGDGTFSTIANPAHTYAQNGLYHVCLTINATAMSNGCTYCHTIGITPNGGIITRQAGFNVVVLPQLTSIDDVKDSPFVIYPNPVKDVLSVESKFITEATELFIYDVNGVVVEKMELESWSSTKINTGAYPAGVYFIKLVQSQTEHVFKFVKN